MSAHLAYAEVVTDSERICKAKADIVDLPDGGFRLTVSDGRGHQLAYYEGPATLEYGTWRFGNGWTATPKGNCRCGGTRVLPLEAEC
ncbi:MAG: hypothetical protein FCKEOINB_02201 [Nitrosomonas sp.]|nr:hypothetical protein [Nitrosomonas sp.]